MTLQNSLYYISSICQMPNGLRFDIHLNKDHIIYNAHFPGQPITPGVCIVQIARELMETHLKTTLRLHTIKNIKFLSPISPEEYPDVSFDLQNIAIEDNDVKFQAVVSSSANTFAKLSLQLSIE